MNLDTYRSLRAPEVAEFFSVGINTVWRWTRERPDFPQPTKIGRKCTVWSLAELIDWRERQGLVAQPDPVVTRQHPGTGESDKLRGEFLKNFPEIDVTKCEIEKLNSQVPPPLSEIAILKERLYRFEQARIGQRLVQVEGLLGAAVVSYEREAQVANDRLCRVLELSLEHCRLAAALVGSDLSEAYATLHEQFQDVHLPVLRRVPGHSEAISPMGKVRHNRASP